MEIEILFPSEVTMKIHPIVLGQKECFEEDRRSRVGNELLLYGRVVVPGGTLALVMFTIPNENEFSFGKNSKNEWILVSVENGKVYPAEENFPENKITTKKPMG